MSVALADTGEGVVVPAWLSKLGGAGLEIDAARRPEARAPDDLGLGLSPSRLTTHLLPTPTRWLIIWAGDGRVDQGLVAPLLRVALVWRAEERRQGGAKRAGHRPRVGRAHLCDGVHVVLRGLPTSALAPPAEQQGA